jgi:hypothetical protein
MSKLVFASTFLGTGNVIREVSYGDQRKDNLLSLLESSELRLRTV